MRKAFVKTLVALAEKDARIFVITPDLGFSVLEEFEDKFPERFLNVGIAEANAIGIASGLALSGKVVFVYSIIPFITMRPFEQIRVDVAYMNTNVRLVGVGAGLSYGPAGATHHAIEDIALMRSLPNMTVVAPCDPWEVNEAIKKSINHQGPIYFRLAKNGEPIVTTDKQQTFSFSKSNVLYSGHDLHILFTSNVADIALDIKSLLDHVSMSLISMHTLKPFDYGCLDQLIKTNTPIFTIEEHSLIGGLGSAVSEYIAESSFNPVFKRFALKDEYSHYVGSQLYIRNKLGFTAKKIAESIMEII